MLLLERDDRRVRVARSLSVLLFWDAMLIDVLLMGFGDTNVASTPP
jgi:hypothetical protein